MAPTFRRFFFAVAVAVLLPGLLVACGESPPPKALVDVVRGAETAYLNLEDFPAAYRRDGNADGVLQPMLDRIEASLGRYYSGGLLTERVAQEQQAVRQTIAARGGGRIGGVTDLSMSGVQVSGHEARAQARVTVWFKSAQFWYQDPGAFPSTTNVLDFALHFIQVDGTWKIDQETDTFAPGGGP